VLLLAASTLEVSVVGETCGCCPPAYRYSFITVGWLCVALQIVTTAVGTLCFPIDTVKRRLMVQSSVAATVTSPTSLGAMPQGIPTASTSAVTPALVTAVPPAELSVRKRPLRVPYKSGWDCARRTIAEEGVRGLFVGLSVNLVRGFSGAVLLVAYDDLKRYL
jgi:hypothetical protein